MTSFHQFPKLPPELQLAIWEFAISGPEPEICLVWPLAIPAYTDPPQEPALPFVVDTGWPTVAHVCRTARKAVLTSGAVRLRHSPAAGLAVPFRRFIPAIDTLYVGRHQLYAVCAFLGRPDNARLARALRYLAVEHTAMLPESVLGELIQQHAVNVRTLTIVFPGTVYNAPWSASFLPPARRCKLCEIPDGTLAGIEVTEIPQFQEFGSDMPFVRETRDDEDEDDPDWSSTPARALLDESRQSMEGYVTNRWSDCGGEGMGPSVPESHVSGLEIKPGMLREYRRTAAGEEDWVEVCAERLLGSGPQDERAPEPRHIPVAERRNPEEYRGLDDDSGAYSVAEYLLMLRSMGLSFTQYFDW